MFIMSIQKFVLFWMWPRGAWKNSQFDFLKETFPEYFTQALSIKDRDPRPNEVLWVDYIQMSSEYFRDKRNNSVFLEKNYHRKYRQRYWTRYEEIENALSTRPVVLKEIEPEWMKKALKKWIPHDFSAFYLNIPDEIIEERVYKRNINASKSEIKEGIKKAIIEREQFENLMTQYPTFDRHRIDGNRPVSEVTKSLLSIRWVDKRINP